MPTYKTKDGTLTGFVPGVGEIVDGKITVPDDIVIENVNLELVTEIATQPVATPAAPVAPATPQSAASAPQPTQEQPINKEAE